ncbi:hypothetical protein D3C87_1854140 [compost metagenome]
MHTDFAGIIGREDNRACASIHQHVHRNAVNLRVGLEMAIHGFVQDDFLSTLTGGHYHRAARHQARQQAVAKPTEIIPVEID